MKKLIKGILLFFGGLTVFSILMVGVGTCSYMKGSSDKDSVSTDSDESSEKGDMVINVDSVIAAHRSDFTFRKDEFENKIWVEPKNAPKYTNVNRIYCYFLLRDKTASDFRFRIQYAADDWLFIKTIMFNLGNDKILTFEPEEMQRDNETSIWEWCDEQIDDKNESLISALAYSKSVKVKFCGRQYFRTRDMTSKELEYIKKTYEFYQALGGKF